MQGHYIEIVGNNVSFCVSWDVSPRLYCFVRTFGLRSLNTTSCHTHRFHSSPSSSPLQHLVGRQETEQEEKQKKGGKVWVMNGQTEEWEDCERQKFERVRE